MGPCFQFFNFCVSYTNLCFYAQGVAMKKWFFHHFFCVINITNTMTNIEIRDFVSIFSGKGLISNPIMENCAEFTQLTLRFHLLSAAQIHDRRARCLMFMNFYQLINSFFSLLNFIVAERSPTIALRILLKLFRMLLFRQWGYGYS